MPILYPLVVRRGKRIRRSNVINLVTRRTAFACLVLFFLYPLSCGAAGVRVTTWNLQWFPNGSPKEVSIAEQAKRIHAAADVLRPLNPDIILLQEVRDYTVCDQLGEAIKPGAYHVAICSAFRDPFTKGLGKQQVAILAKEYAQAAWAESWKSMEGVDPPRGFAFAWYRVNGADVGLYSVHLKSNLIMVRDKEREAQRNIKRREVAGMQVVQHVRDVIGKTMPKVKGIVVGGDFNTNKDQPMFSAEKTFETLLGSGFRNCLDALPLAQRITHPGESKYPDATFDYLFYCNMTAGKPVITQSAASDHYPVSCDFRIQSDSAPTIVSASPPVEKPIGDTVRIVRETTIQIPYGSTRIPAGSVVKAIRRNADSVDVEYLGGVYRVPVANIAPFQ
jgi:endonuclease/exonuclease/phosphatase family metal-dependent hydrolase